MSTGFVLSVEAKSFFMPPTNNPLNGRRGYFVQSKRQDVVNPSLKSDKSGSCDSYNTILDADLGSFFDPNFPQGEVHLTKISNSSIKSEYKVPINDKLKLSGPKSKANTTKSPSANSKNHSSKAYVIPHLRGDRSPCRSLSSKVTEYPPKNHSPQNSHSHTLRNGDMLSNTNRNHSPKSAPPAFSDLAFESDRIHSSLRSRSSLKSPSKFIHLPNTSFPPQKITSYSFEAP
ncbi:hypothetical protein DSO57_1016156 [Entomophthora muscae]|uniref:Uncharacterized protein n=1 Tax=Entomophthora muscae TaxID=34485 RepID=A0ACC2U3E7_9FUNG|nr:hypothetical protein DSO57_1016156 [Entomophthora muscae]